MFLETIYMDNYVICKSRWFGFLLSNPCPCDPAVHFDVLWLNKRSGPHPTDRELEILLSTQMWIKPIHEMQPSSNVMSQEGCPSHSWGKFGRAAWRRWSRNWVLKIKVPCNLSLFPFHLPLFSAFPPPSHHMAERVGMLQVSPAGRAHCVWGAGQQRDQEAIPQMIPDYAPNRRILIPHYHLP